MTLTVRRLRDSRIHLNPDSRRRHEFHTTSRKQFCFPRGQRGLKKSGRRLVHRRRRLNQARSAEFVAWSVSLTKMERVRNWTELKKEEKDEGGCGRDRDRVERKRDGIHLLLPSSMPMYSDKDYGEIMVHTIGCEQINNWENSQHISLWSRLVGSSYTSYSYLNTWALHFEYRGKLGPASGINERRRNSFHSAVTERDSWNTRSSRLRALGSFQAFQPYRWAEIGCISKTDISLTCILGIRFTTDMSKKSKNRLRDPAL